VLLTIAKRNLLCYIGTPDRDNVNLTGPYAMPCDSSQGLGDAYREDPEARRQMQAMKKELDHVTSMLCSLLGLLIKTDLTSLPTNIENIMPPEIQKWYEAHKAWDKSQGRK
jgi:hypothetical protein